MALHNKINNKELKEKLQKSNEDRLTISFYKYHQIENPEEFRDLLYQRLDTINVLGRIYLANEGINAQISILAENLDVFKEKLYSIDWLNQVRLNVAVQQGASFFKLTIKVKEKIVADGLDDSTFDPTDTGKYLKAKDFNELTDDPETILVDMRNHYETEVGHFKGAVCPDVDTFREELKVVEDMLDGKEDKNIVMYCTGGIRCEKATAYFKHKGYDKVHHLEGGIIKYANDVKEAGLENKFIGKNFVFDERLGERISDDVIAKCHQCGALCDDHVNCKNDGCHLLFIQCPSCAKKYDGCCSESCKEVYHLAEDKQKEVRKGKNLGRQVFKKGRFIRDENGNLKKV